MCIRCALLAHVDVGFSEMDSRYITPIDQVNNARMTWSSFSHFHKLELQLEDISQGITNLFKGMCQQNYS